jgi:hypothetical protein
LCIDSDVKDETIFTSECDEEKISQKFIFGFVNETLLNNWLDYGKPIKDEQEIEDLRNLQEI